jgi:hypothetical protein
MQFGIIQGKKAGAGGVLKGQFVTLSSGAWIAAGVSNAMGVALSTQDAGELVDVQIAGEADCLVTSALNVGEEISVDANGRAVDNTTTAGHLIMGVALTTGAAISGSSAAFARVVLATRKIAN